MRSTDLENLYSRINGHILLVGAYTQDPVLVKIIRGCRLKPYSAFTRDFQPGTRFEQHWVDEFGNSLKFEDKTPKIVMNDTQIAKNTQTSTDLFYGSSMRTTARNSNFALIAGGYFDSKCYFVAFKGQDDYLRAFFFHKEWSRISPLLLGISTLRELFSHMNNVLINNLNINKLDFSFNFDVEKCIITSWPPKQNLLTYFDDETLINNIL